MKQTKMRIKLIKFIFNFLNMEYDVLYNVEIKDVIKQTLIGNPIEFILEIHKFNLI